jgi:hypothetical protein
LFLTSNEETLNQGLIDLESFVPNIISLMPNSQHKFNVSNQIAAQMYKRDLLLKEAVHPLAKFLNYEVFQDYTCERANIFFETIVKPIHERSS